MNAAHTPAPWRVFGGAKGSGFKVIDANGKSIAAFPSTSRRPNEEKTANAHLIAVAPNLLAVAQAMVAALEARQFQGKLLDDARAIIAQALPPTTISKEEIK